MSRGYKVPGWLLVWGIIALPGTAYLVGRLIWEQTILSWERGPQMVGFSLAHSGRLLPLLFSVLLYVLWFGAIFIGILRASVRCRRVPPAGDWLLLLISGSLLALLLAPYGLWQRCFAARIARGPFATEFFTYAAATGDLPTVKALLKRGVGIDSRNSDGSTALYGAAVEGKLRVIRYLLAHGANPNITNHFGSTALGAAKEMGHPEAEAFLAGHGAR